MGTFENQNSLFCRTQKDASGQILELTHAQSDNDAEQLSSSVLDIKSTIFSRKRETYKAKFCNANNDAKISMLKFLNNLSTLFLPSNTL